MQNAPIVPFTAREKIAIQHITSQAWAEGWSRTQYIAALREVKLLRFAEDMLVR